MKIVENIFRALPTTSLGLACLSFGFSLGEFKASHENQKVADSAHAQIDKSIGGIFENKPVSYPHLMGLGLVESTNQIVAEQNKDSAKFGVAMGAIFSGLSAFSFAFRKKEEPSQ